MSVLTAPAPWIPLNLAVLCLGVIVDEREDTIDCRAVYNSRRYATCPRCAGGRSLALATILDREPEPSPRVLWWNGAGQLTVVGQAHFAVWVWTPFALAEAILLLAIQDELLPAEIAEAFALEILRRLPLDEPFQMHAGAVRAWATTWRREGTPPMPITA